MAHGDDALSALREALRLSPTTFPASPPGRHAPGSGRPEEAEKGISCRVECRPGDVRLKIGLANAFYQQGKEFAMRW